MRGLSIDFSSIRILTIKTREILFVKKNFCLHDFFLL